MAEIKQGILGATRGKIGPVVGYIWRGVNYLRSKPQKSKKKATQKQLLQWDKMSLVSTYASKFRDFVNEYCPTVKVGEKWMNGKEQMISRLMKQGITMINGLQHVEIEKTILSIGNLAPAVIRKINIMKTGKLKVQWDNSLVNALTLDTDFLTMMLYNETLDKFVAIANVGKRADKYAHFSMPKDWNMGKVYFWSMWKSADGSVHSTSCFHGMIELVEDNLTIENEGEKEVKAMKKLQEAYREKVKTELLAVEETSTLGDLAEIEEIALPFINKKSMKLIDVEEEMPSVIVVEIADKEVTTSTFRHTLKKEELTEELKLKKWTPPGYTRRVNKQILKGEVEVEANRDYASSKPKGVFENVCSIIDLPDIRVE